MLSRFPTPAAITDAVAPRCQELLADTNPQLDFSARRALSTTLSLAAAHPHDPGAMAPLFLRRHDLPAGASLPLGYGLPVVVLRGELEVALGTHDRICQGAFGRGDSNARATDRHRFANLLAPAPPAWWSGVGASA